MVWVLKRTRFPFPSKKPYNIPFNVMLVRKISVLSSDYIASDNFTPVLLLLFTPVFPGWNIKFLETMSIDKEVSKAKQLGHSWQAFLNSNMETRDWPCGYCKNEKILEKSTNKLSYILKRDEINRVQSKENSIYHQHLTHSS